MQNQPVKRLVALKVLKHGLGSMRLQARFEVEQQALARLDHAHIARFFHGGTTPDGRPYFAMEWIQGESITGHVRSHRLSLPERLGLFEQVCDAIQHAHQKGIIHRDIKSSNVLVAGEAGSAAAKVIDFGIARCLEDPLCEFTLLTHSAEVLGTPASMSPEQLDGQVPDARTDVYGLGVLLYELLSGSLPFNPGQPEDVLRRRIRESDPDKPSSHILNRAESKLLKGDLDWIVLRCLEKNPARRYPSVSELLKDLERFRHNEPVAAGPPELAYRARKFVRRNRIAMVAGLMIVASLVLGLVISLFGYSEARVQEGDAMAARALAEIRLADSEEARKEAEAVSVFVHQLLDADRDNSRLDLDRLLGHASALLNRDAFPNPESWASLQQKVARLHYWNGRPEVAIPLLEEVAKYYAESGSGDESQLRVNTSNLVDCYRAVGRDQEALALVQKLLKKIETAASPNPESVIDAAEQLSLSFEIIALQCRPDVAAFHRQESLRYAELVRDTYEKNYGGIDQAPSRETAEKYLNSLGKLGQLERAIQGCGELLRREEIESGPSSVYTTGLMRRLAYLHQAAGDHEKSIEVSSAMRDRLEKVLGPVGLETLGARYDSWALRVVADEAQRPNRQPPGALIKEGEALLRDLEQHASIQNQVAQDTFRTLLVNYFRAGEDQRSITLLERLLPAVEEVLTPWHERRLDPETMLFHSYHRTGAYREAYSHLCGILAGLHAGDLGEDESHLVGHALARCFSMVASRPDKLDQMLVHLAARSHLATGDPALARDLFLLYLIPELLEDPLLSGDDEPFMRNDFKMFGLSGLSELPELRLSAPRVAISYQTEWSVFCERDAGEPLPDWKGAEPGEGGWRILQSPLTSQDKACQRSIWQQRDATAPTPRAFFRKEFTWEKDFGERRALLQLQAGAGATVFLNGQRIGSFPSGKITPAVRHEWNIGHEIIGDTELDGEAYSIAVWLDSADFVDGRNVLAVEVPQQSDEYSFLAKLVVYPGPGFLGDLSSLFAGFDPTAALSALRSETGLELKEPMPDWQPLVRSQLAALDGQWQDVLKITEPLLARIDHGTKQARVLARLRWFARKQLGDDIATPDSFAVGVPMRSPDASSHQIDLGSHYNLYLDDSPYRRRSGIGFFPDGMLPQELPDIIRVGSLSFDVRGMIRVRGARDPLYGGEGRHDYLLEFPAAVRGIPVGRITPAIHFLHAGSVTAGNRNPEWENREVIANYVIHYEDGDTAVVPVRADKGVFNNFYLPSDGTPPEQFSLPRTSVWCRNGPLEGYYTVLYVRSWLNPRPDVPVHSIDVVSGEKDTALMVFGITIDPPEQASELPPVVELETLMGSGLGPGDVRVRNAFERIDFSPPEVELELLRGEGDFRGRFAQQVFVGLVEEGLKQREGLTLLKGMAGLGLEADQATQESFFGRILETFRHSTPDDQARIMCRILLLPGSREDPDLVDAGVSLARRAIELDPTDMNTSVERALVAYRLGNYADAWSLIEAAPETEDPDTARMLLLLRAMTAAQRGDRREALSALEAVRPVIKRREAEIGRGNINASWHVNVIHRLFLSEAEDLMVSKQAD